MSESVVGQSPGHPLVGPLRGTWGYYMGVSVAIVVCDWYLWYVFACFNMIGRLHAAWILGYTEPLVNYPMPHFG